MLNLASSKLSSTGRVARKKWLFISAHGLQAVNHGHGTFQAGILLAQQTLAHNHRFNSTISVQDQDAHPEGTESVASIQLFQVQKSQTSTHAKIFMSHRGKLPRPPILQVPRNPRVEIE
jgi:hypothetical protein